LITQSEKSPLPPERSGARTSAKVFAAKLEQMPSIQDNGDEPTADARSRMPA
jgi:hypothetical protein